MCYVTISSPPPYLYSSVIVGAKTNWSKFCYLDHHKSHFHQVLTNPLFPPKTSFYETRRSCTCFKKYFTFYLHRISYLKKNEDGIFLTRGGERLCPCQQDSLGYLDQFLQVTFEMLQISQVRLSVLFS